MRRAAWLAIAMLLLPGTARGARPAPGPVAARPVLRVLASFLPMYVFARNVAGGVPGVEVDLMLPASLGCPHDYALTPGDMRKIAAASILIANGFGMEEFLGQPVLRANPKITVVETAAAVAPIRTGGPGHGAVNPHTWVSPRNAILQVRAIERALSAASPADADAFRRNADAYVARLTVLADDFDAAAKRFRVRNVVTFHDVFDYLARDIGIAVVGEIEETPGQEPSAGEIQALVRTIRGTGAAAVFAEPQYPERLAAIVAGEAGVPLRMLDPVSTGPATPSAYEDAMRKNLATLIGALGSR
ncbi:MAG: metal ABC transporter substrate-binding protein [Gemmatimonadota bacterium]